MNDHIEVLRGQIEWIVRNLDEPEKAAKHTYRGIAAIKHVAQAALAAMGGEQVWRPIETAPRDGTEILMTNGSVVHEGQWFHDEGGVFEHRDMDGRYIGQDESDGYDGWIDWGGGMIPGPTHWMPLPPPPGGKERG